MPVEASICTMNENQKKPTGLPAYRFSVAPMMDWTDRHCRYFHRLMTRRALLYTEMISAPALLHGDADRLLAHDPAEHPVALQLGGSDPSELSAAARLGAKWGFAEINLNVGCPSDKVQGGCFGAVLMKDPQRTADCLRAMVEGAGETEVTLKCRIGVDEQEPEKTLPGFIEVTSGTGVGRIAIHARKAWLSGLSPKQNREIPPLDYGLVVRMKRNFPHLKICINGGITSLEDALALLEDGLDGVMVGRAAYRSPADMLSDVDRRIFGEDHTVSRAEVVSHMLAYIRQHRGEGGKTTAITRHMLGMFSGCPGARRWRRTLSDPALNAGQGLQIIEQACRAIAESRPDRPVASQNGSAALGARTAVDRFIDAAAAGQPAAP